MCEIAVLDSDPVVENAEAFVHNIEQSLYKTNNDGLGFVAVYPGDEHFTTSYIKCESITDGNRDEYIDWVENQGDSWRIIVHARLATNGGTGTDQAHPIIIEDDDVDANMVIHNGVVRRSRTKRRSLKRDGHEFNTKVDTEVIAHQYDTLPDDLDDFEPNKLSGSLNYLLIGDEQILVRSEKYIVTDDFRMTCRSEWYPDDEDTEAPDKANAELISIRPDKSMERRTVKQRSTAYSGSSAGWSSRYKSNRQSGHGSHYVGVTEREDLADWDIDTDEETVLDWQPQEKNSKSICHTKVARSANSPSSISYPDENCGIKLTARKDTSGDTDKLNVYVVDKNGSNQARPLPGAKVYIYAPAAHSYDDEGVYTTDGNGHVNVELAKQTTYIRLIDVPVEDMDIPNTEPDESDSDGDNPNESSGNQRRGGKVFPQELRSGQELVVAWKAGIYSQPKYNSTPVVNIPSGTHVTVLSEPETGYGNEVWVNVAPNNTQYSDYSGYISASQLYWPADDSVNDDDDDDDDDQVDADEVSVWTMYSKPTSSRDGYCTAHNTEFDDRCSVCEENFSNEELKRGTHAGLIERAKRESHDGANRYEKNKISDIEIADTSHWTLLQGSGNGWCNVHAHSFSGHCISCADDFDYEEFRDNPSEELEARVYAERYRVKDKDDSSEVDDETDDADDADDADDNSEVDDACPLDDGCGCADDSEEADECEWDNQTDPRNVDESKVSAWMTYDEHPNVDDDTGYCAIHQSAFENGGCHVCLAYATREELQWHQQDELSEMVEHRREGVVPPKQDSIDDSDDSDDDNDGEDGSAQVSDGQASEDSTATSTSPATQVGKLF